MSATTTTLAPLRPCPIDGNCKKGKRHREGSDTMLNCQKRAGGAAPARSEAPTVSSYVGIPHRSLRARLGEATEALRVRLADRLKTVAAELRNYDLDYRHDPLTGHHRFVFTDRRDGSWHSVGSSDLRSGWAYNSGLAGQEADRSRPLTGENYVARFAAGAGGDTTDLSAEEVAHRTQVHIKHDERRRQDPVEVVVGLGEPAGQDEVSVESLTAHQVGNWIRGDYEDCSAGNLVALPTYTDGVLSRLEVQFTQGGQTRKTWVLTGEHMPELAPSSQWPQPQTLDWGPEVETDWLMDRVQNPSAQGEGWNDASEPIGSEDGEAQSPVVVPQRNLGPRHANPSKGKWLRGVFGR